MKLLRHLVVLLIAAAMLASTACERRRPKLPATATAPTTLPEPEGPKPVTTETVEPPVVHDTTPVPAETATITKPKPKPTRKITRKVVPAEPAPTPPPAPTKPSDSGVQITAELPKSASMRQNTEQLLESTENNLKRINRNLNDGEQSMVRQIRSYIVQARTAVDAGDLERAYNLATKANLLSNELVK